jgi:hypothetical protein
MMEEICERESCKLAWMAQLLRAFQQFVSTAHQEVCRPVVRSWSLSKIQTAATRVRPSGRAVLLLAFAPTSGFRLKSASQMMRRSSSFVAFLIAAALVALTVVAISEARRASMPQKPLSEPTAQTQQRLILVEAPVKVSLANFSKPHNEVQIAADPTDAKRLVACSMMMGDDSMGDDRTYLRPFPYNIIVYTSIDYGLSWQPTYEIDKRQFWPRRNCILHGFRWTCLHKRDRLQVADAHVPFSGRCKNLERGGRSRRNRSRVHHHR